jgi:hypothetical protein
MQLYPALVVGLKCPFLCIFLGKQSFYWPVKVTRDRVGTNAVIFAMFSGSAGFS